jgi:hypothetical protein
MEFLVVFSFCVFFSFSFLHSMPQDIVHAWTGRRGEEELNQAFKRRRAGSWMDGWMDGRDEHHG